MAFNILDHLTLAYQPVWDRQHGLCAVRLRVRALDPESVDAVHFLHLLSNEWTAHAPVPIVSFADSALLAQALEAPPRAECWLELPDWGDFAPPDAQQRVERALSLGHRLLQTAPLARARVEREDTANGAPHDRLRYLLNLWPEDAALALLAAEERALPVSARTHLSPVLPDQLYQNLGSQALAEHCLRDQRAWGVCGWPTDDVLHAHRQYGLPPDRLAIVRVLHALQEDKSMETIVELIHQDPVLSHRMLRMVNSAVIGSRRPIESIRHAIMMLGQTATRNWLNEQNRGASTDSALLPVRETLVLRARFMRQLMDAGAEHDLQEEIYLTGLFSQLDRLLHQPLAEVLAHLPLSDRVLAALLHRDGPYFSYLDVAARMESFQGLDLLPSVCAEHEFQLDQVNRALIRMLSHLDTRGF